MFSVATAVAITIRSGLVDGVAHWDGPRATSMSMPSVMVEHWGGGSGVHGRYHFDESVPGCSEKEGIIL